ncbi:hypothetical protein DL96DRAFT_1805648 [Flagelloscypha sp. PMI_526]|nr:hypothetical protein DL96DRAFT_1805648 [Flagelloscypha sp. PMI_526]
MRTWTHRIVPRGFGPRCTIRQAFHATLADGIHLPPVLIQRDGIPLKFIAAWSTAPNPTTLLTKELSICFSKAEPVSCILNLGIGPDLDNPSRSVSHLCHDLAPFFTRLSVEQLHPDFGDDPSQAMLAAVESYLLADNISDLVDGVVLAVKERPHIFLLPRRSSLAYEEGKGQVQAKFDHLRTTVSLSRLTEILQPSSSVSSFSPTSYQGVSQIYSIEFQRASWKSEIASLETRLMSLRPHFNMLSPINRLPMDIFLDIIILIRGVPNSNFGWVQGITDVCSYWRSVALGQRELWATVFLSSNHVALQTPIFTLLRRANGCPIMVHAPSSSLLIGDEKIAPFKIHSYALGGFLIEDCVSLDHLSQILRIKQDIRVPLLHTLRIEKCSDSFQSVQAITSFLSQRCPSLRSVRIPSLFLGPAELRALNLTHLSLIAKSEDQTRDDVIKPFDVLAELTHCSSLRTLELHSLYTRYYDHSPSSVKLALPMLNSLTLKRAYDSSAVNILQAITSPFAFDICCIRTKTRWLGAPDEDKEIELQPMCDLVELMLGHCCLRGSHLQLYDYDGDVIESEDQPHSFGFRLEENARSVCGFSLALPSIPRLDVLYNALLARLDPTAFSNVSFVGGSALVADLPFFGACTATTIRVNLWRAFPIAAPAAALTIPFPLVNRVEILDLDDFPNANTLISTLWWRYRRGLPIPQVVFVECGEIDLDQTATELLSFLTNGVFVEDSSGQLQPVLLRIDPQDLPLWDWGRT